VHMPAGRYTTWDTAGAAGENQFSVPYGALQSSTPVALAYREYLQRFEATRDGLGEFLVNNRANAQLNARAFFRDQTLTLDDYLLARLIVDPIGLFDCDIPLDGCGALVLASADHARDLKHPPAYIRGYGQGTMPGPSTMWYKGANLDHMWSAGESLATKLWSTSGLAPTDVQAAMVYDGFSPFILWWLESLGFCDRGEAWQFVQGDVTHIGGQLPVNTNGGSLGEGRLHGMAHLSEAVYQVTGRAQERQINDVQHVVVTIGPMTMMSGGFVISGTAE
jgi:acetyl-CoA acetyltransferase